MGYKHIFLVYPCSSILKLKKNDNTVVISDKLMIYHEALEENYPILLTELAKQGNATIGYLNWRAVYWFDNFRKSGKLRNVPVTLIYPNWEYGELWKNHIQELYNKKQISNGEYNLYYKEFDSNMRYLFQYEPSIKKRTIDLFPGIMYSGDPKELDLEQIVYNPKL